MLELDLLFSRLAKKFFAGIGPMYFLWTLSSVLPAAKLSLTFKPFEASKYGQAQKKIAELAYFVPLALSQRPWSQTI